MNLGLFKLLMQKMSSEELQNTIGVIRICKNTTQKTRLSNMNPTKNWV